ncbi:MAG TPA: tetratricopeptide repeat protein [Puia sp.]|nr:tetratricopeptide repeat protein [Puia sp.]
MFRYHKYLLTIFLSVLSSFTSDAQGTSQSIPKAGLEKADSLFYARDWSGAKRVYEMVLKDSSRNALEWNRLGFCDLNLKLYVAAMSCFKKSLLQDPPPPLRAVVYSRMARIYALQKNNETALANLDSAVAASYINLHELDSLSDFDTLRNEKHFKEIRKKVYILLYPCMADPHAREFDFWIGEWNVYQTGTKNYQGHSLVQMIAGGCAILENWDSQNSTGKSINFIDPVTNTWKQSWAGSYASGIQEFVHGRYLDSAMRFDFETTDSRGNKTIGRFIFYNQGPDQIRQFNESSADGGRTWTTNYDFTYQRIKQ